MKNKENGRALPATGSVPSPADFPIGSAASRAAARARLDRIPAPPDIVVRFVTATGELAICDRAMVNGEDVTRLPNESQDDFENRLRSMVRRHPEAIIMFGNHDAKNSDQITGA